MNHANTVICVARGRHSLPSVVALRSPAVWLVCEDVEYYIPNVLEDAHWDANPALTDAASAHTLNARDAQQQLEDAESLVGLLLDAVEHDRDTRAVQTRTVLEFAIECLHEAHHLIDAQASRDRNLCLAYFELKGEMEEEGEEDAAPPLDD